MQTGHVLAALVGLVGLGVSMGFSPTLYDMALRVMTKRTTARGSLSGLLALTGGLAAASTLLLLVFRAVDPETLIALWRGRAEAFLVRRAVDLVAGVLLLLTALLAAFVWARRPPKVRKERRRSESGRRLFAIGFVNTLVGVSGIATMYVTGRVITAASTQWWVRGVLYVVFLVALVGPYLAAGWAWERFVALQRMEARVHHWVTTHDLRGLAVAAVAAAGVVFLVLGLRG